MKKIKRWRYYCDFCGKSSGSGGHMSRHEKRCTANPNRVCGMCGHVGIKGFIEALGAGDEDGVDKLRDATNGCAACMLAAVRQSGLQDRQDETLLVLFNYEEEKIRYWAEFDDRM